MRSRSAPLTLAACLVFFAPAEVSAKSQGFVLAGVREPALRLPDAYTNQNEIRRLQEAVEILLAARRGEFPEAVQPWSVSDVLVEFARHGEDDEIRVTAVRALGELEARIDSLLSLHAKPRDVFAWLVQAATNEGAVALGEALVGGSPAVRLEAMKALDYILPAQAESATPYLCAAARDPDPAIRAGVATVSLLMADPGAACPDLLALARDADSVVRAAGIDAVGRSRLLSGHAAPLAREAMDDPDPAARASAIRGLCGGHDQGEAFDGVMVGARRAPL